MKAQARSGNEYELVLIVISRSPDEVLQRISEATSVGEYQLVQNEARRIHDIYFDTEDSSLSRHRLNLRLRSLEGLWRVTLKKSPGLFSRNRSKRKETELVWTRESWDVVLREIFDNGVKFKPKSTVSVFDDENPKVSLLAMGLRVIQDRETLRRTTTIFRTKGEILAELAVDRVTYHFGSRDVSLDELEFESKSEGGNSELESITRSFERRFAPDLKRWRMGKLRTGEAIRGLMEKGRLDEVTDSTGRLKPEAYDLIVGA